MFMLSEQARAPAIHAASDIAARARDTAPRGDGERDGHYADHFEVVAAGTWTAGNGNRRAIALVTNDDPAAAAIEFGNRRGAPAHRTLRKAADAAGPVVTK